MTKKGSNEKRKKSKHLTLTEKTWNVGLKLSLGGRKTRVALERV